MRWTGWENLSLTPCPQNAICLFAYDDVYSLSSGWNVALTILPNSPLILEQDWLDFERSSLSKLVGLFPLHLEGFGYIPRSQAVLTHKNMILSPWSHLQWACCDSIISYHDYRIRCTEILQTRIQRLLPFVPQSVFVLFDQTLKVRVGLRKYLIHPAL